MIKPLSARGRVLLIALLAFFAWIEGPRWHDALLVFDGEDTARVHSRKHVPFLRRYAPEITVETSGGLRDTFVCPKSLQSLEPGATIDVVTSSRFGNVSTHECLVEKRKVGLMILLSLAPLVGFWLLYRLAIWHRKRTADTWSNGGFGPAAPPMIDSSHTRERGH